MTQIAIAQETPPPPAVALNGAAKPEAKPEPAKEKAKPKSRLKAVDPKAAEPSKPKILIFGKPGVGKTWTSLDFPNVYYIDTEGGADLQHYTDKLKASGGMYLGPDEGSLSFDTVLEQLQALATEEHQFKTVVIDSISKLFNLEVSREGERLGDKNAFGADKKPAIANMRKLVSWLSRMDMNVILIAHEKPLWGIDAKGERSEIGTTFDCWDKLEYELHLCLNIFKAGASHKARVRKSRLTGFPDATVFDWSYPSFAERYGKDVIEKAVTQLALATPEQIAEVNRLLGIVKLSESAQDKWIEDNKSALSEVESEKMDKIINHLKAKVSA